MKGRHGLEEKLSACLHALGTFGLHADFSWSFNREIKGPSRIGADTIVSLCKLLDWARKHLHSKDEMRLVRRAWVQLCRVSDCDGA